MSPKRRTVTKRRPAARPTLSAARLAELIEAATVDCHDEDEQRVGFLTMLEEHLALPFETEVLGVAVRVTGVEMNAAEDIVAVCERGRYVQRVPVVDLPLPRPRPEGWEWIEAYRAWRGGE